MFLCLEYHAPLSPHPLYRFPRYLTLIGAHPGANNSFRSEILKVSRKGVASPKTALVLIFGTLRVAGLQRRDIWKPRLFSSTIIAVGVGICRGF